MMLVLSGMPPDMPVAVLRNMIQQTCNVEYVLIEEQERHSFNEPRSVTVGCPGEMAGQRILQCLNGMMLGPHRLYVAPFVSQALPQREFYADEDDPMTGLSNKVPPWKQPQEWSTRRSDVNCRPSPDDNCAAPGLDARPPYGAAGAPSAKTQEWSTRRSDINYRPLTDASCVAPGLDARPPYGATGPPSIQSTLSKVPPWFQARSPSPVRERSPIRVWQEPTYSRREPSPDRQGRDSSFRDSEHYGSVPRDSYSDRHERAGRDGVHSHRDADMDLTRNARKRVAELEKRQPYFSKFASSSGDVRKGIPSLLQPLGSLPVPRRPASSDRSQGTRGRISGPGFRSESRPDGKADRRPDLSRRPNDRRMVVLGANARSAPQFAAKSGQKIPQKSFHKVVVTERDLVETVEKKIVESMFNSRPQPGTGVKPKYKKFMEALKREVRKRLSSIRGDARDPETLHQRYITAYSQGGNRKTRRKNLLVTAAGTLPAKHDSSIVEHLLMETPWVSPVELDNVPDSQRKDFRLKKLLGRACDQICNTWLKPPQIDALRFAQELARLDNTDTPGNASSGVLSWEDKLVYDRFKLLTFRSLRKHVAPSYDSLGTKPGKIARSYMTELAANRETHLNEAVAYCKRTFTTYDGVYSKLGEITTEKALEAPPTKKGDTRVDSCSSSQHNSNNADRGGSQIVEVNNHENANSAEQGANAASKQGANAASKQGANAASKQTLLRKLFDEASQLASRGCLKPPEMGVLQFIRELENLDPSRTSTFSDDEVWTGKLSVADAAVYEHFKKLTFRKLLLLAQGGQMKLNLTPEQMAEVYRNKYRVAIEQHLKNAIKHCETLHGPYRGVIGQIRSVEKAKAPKTRTVKMARIIASASVATKILEDNNMTKRCSPDSEQLYVKLRKLVTKRMSAIQDQLTDDAKKDMETLVKRYRELHSDDQELMQQGKAPDVDIDEIEIHMDDLEDF